MIIFLYQDVYYRAVIFWKLLDTVNPNWVTFYTSLFFSQMFRNVKIKIKTKNNKKLKFTLRKHSSLFNTHPSV